MKQALKERKKMLDSCAAFRTIQNVLDQIQDFPAPTRVTSKHIAAKPRVEEGMK
jgi:hypothetical protein